MKFLKKLFWQCIWYIFIPHICIAHTGGQYAVNDICIILFQKIRLLKSYAQRQFIRINQLPKEQYNAPNHISYESNKKNRQRIIYHFYHIYFLVFLPEQIPLPQELPPSTLFGDKVSNYNIFNYPYHCPYCTLYFPKQCWLINWTLL